MTFRTGPPKGGVSGRGNPTHLRRIGESHRTRQTAGAGVSHQTVLPPASPRAITLEATGVFSGLFFRLSTPLGEVAGHKVTGRHLSQFWLRLPVAADGGLALLVIDRAAVSEAAADLGPISFRDLPPS